MSVMRCAKPQGALSALGSQRSLSGAPLVASRPARRPSAPRQPQASARDPGSQAQHSQPSQVQQQQQQQQQHPGALAPQVGSSGSGAHLSAAAVAAVACGVGCVPVLLPTAASASSVLATIVPHSLQQHHFSETLTLGCTAAGAACLLTTLVCTARFLVSYYPALEAEVEQRRWALPWRAVTLFDPLLQPLRRRFFRQTDPGDLDYAAVALLAVVCSLLECLVGKDGLLNDSIPDFALLAALQWLILFQHGMLLPAWVIVVLRWGRVL